MPGAVLVTSIRLLDLLICGFFNVCLFTVIDGFVNLENAQVGISLQDEISKSSPSKSVGDYRGIGKAHCSNDLQVEHAS